MYSCKSRSPPSTQIRRAIRMSSAFDVQTIAVVLPVLAGQCRLSPGEIGLLISTGFIGQLAGAFLFGWIAEKFGRLTAMVYSVAVLALMSLACAAAWNYASLFVFRTIQGIAIGGEVPVAATYISELSPAHRRGRFFLLYEMLFSIGLGFMLTRYNLGSVFLSFAAVSLVGSVVAGLFAMETRERVLEEISP
jgi:MFS family permease